MSRLRSRLESEVANVLLIMLKIVGDGQGSRHLGQLAPLESAKPPALVQSPGSRFSAPISGRYRHDNVQDGGGSNANYGGQLYSSQPNGILNSAQSSTYCSQVDCAPHG